MIVFGKPLGVDWTRRARIACAWAALSCAAFSACATAPRPAQDDYSGQAKYAYEEGMAAFESSEYLESVKRFNYVRTKFPYSKYAALASLRIGDTYFAQGQMPSAIEGYRRFVQLHPTHPDVPYANYRVCLAFFEQLPGDWFFLPPAYEKDLASTEDALDELETFLRDHGTSQYAEEIHEKLVIVRQRLADHEFFVATFYLEREQPRAAALRLRYLLDHYPGVGFDEEAAFLLGKSYLMLGDVGQAVQTWQGLSEQYPQHPLAREAQSYMRRYQLAAPRPSAQNAAP